jgi:hypothetical protein
LDGLHHVLLSVVNENNTKSRLIHISGTLNSESYISQLLKVEAIPLVLQSPGRVFQQDNARCHIFRASMACLDSFCVEVLPWPARSPDLSPIEHLWDELRRAVQNNYGSQQQTYKNCELALMSSGWILNKVSLIICVTACPNGLNPVFRLMVHTHTILTEHILPTGIKVIQSNTLSCFFITKNRVVWELVYTFGRQCKSFFI